MRLTRRGGTLVATGILVSPSGELWLTTGIGTDTVLASPLDGKGQLSPGGSRSWPRIRREPSQTIIWWREP